jgi:putative transposase
VILAHRIALDPTVEQSIALSRACGCARFTWNWALAEWDKQYKAGEKPTALKLKVLWNSIKEKEFPWIYDSPKDANQQPFANLQKAFTKFFKTKKGHPKFKKRGVRDSFYVSNDKFSVDEFVIKLPIIGSVRMREELRFDGKINAAVVSREADRWFISVQVEAAVEHLSKTDKTVGIDLGLKTAVVCSDGKTFDAPKPLKSNLKRLRRLSRRHSRKQKGSANRKKSQRRLSRLHVRIKNIRRDWTHKVTSKLIRENQTISIEDLNVKGMMANRKLSRAISDVGWFDFRRQLEYKAATYGRTISVIGRFQPSSKVCSNCGCKKDVLALSERVYHCDHCGVEIDRDLNAAININTAGLAGINACGPEGSGDARKSSTKPRRVEAGTKPRGHSRALTN